MFETSLNIAIYHRVSIARKEVERLGIQRGMQDATQTTTVNPYGVGRSGTWFPEYRTHTDNVDNSYKVKRLRST